VARVISPTRRATPTANIRITALRATRRVGW
jgi:hypothetical protein